MPCPAHAQRFAPGAAAHARWYGRSVERASNRARNASFVSPACSLCSGMQRNERGVQRYSSFITVTRLRIDASSHGETANGAAASAKSELVTYAYTPYYVRTFKRSTIHPPSTMGRVWLDMAAWAQTNIRCPKSEDLDTI